MSNQRFLSRNELSAKLSEMMQGLRSVPVNAESEKGIAIGHLFGRRDAVDAVNAIIKDYPWHQHEAGETRGEIYCYNGFICKEVVIQGIDSLRAAGKLVSAVEPSSSIAQGIREGFQAELSALRELIGSMEGIDRESLLFPLQGF